MEQARHKTLEFEVLWVGQTQVALREPGSEDVKFPWKTHKLLMSTKLVWQTRH